MAGGLLAVTVALYRRYRPDTFSDVIGQDHVTDLLKNALDRGRVSHAYLFSGPRGCGKTTSARIMARCLNCEQGPTSAPCGVCDSCLELAAGGPGSLDVVEIDAASNSGVDDARELRERAGFAPTRDRFKIFILDEAHMVTKAGFNALLKLVEEPPEHVKFIFATTEPERVIGTIKSRTHHYPFRLVAPTVLQSYLQTVSEKEGIPIEEGVLPLVVTAGGGSVRDSLSVLDQLMSGSDETGVTYSQTVDLLGFTDASLLDKMMVALGDGDGAAVFQVIEEMSDTGHDPRRFTEDLLQRVRDVLICAVAAPQASAILPHVPADQLERMRGQANNWGSQLLSRRADLIDEALRTMGGATSPRLQVELLMGRLLVAELEPKTEPAEVQAPAAKRPAAKSTPPLVSPQTPVPTREPVLPPTTVYSRAETARPSPKPADRAESTAADTSLPSVQARWPEVGNAIGKLSRVSQAVLQQTEITGVDGTVISLSSSGTASGRLREGNPDFVNLQKAVQQVFGGGWSAVLASAAPAPKAPEVAEKSSVSAVAEPSENSSPKRVDGWGPVAVPGRQTSEDQRESEVGWNPKVSGEAPAVRTPQIIEVPSSETVQRRTSDHIGAQPNGPQTVEDGLPTPPDWTEDAAQNPPFEAADEPDMPSDWDSGISLDDETIESPTSPSLPLLLETLGGKVIETITEKGT